jgi:hypothetical protein
MQVCMSYSLRLFFLANAPPIRYFAEGGEGVAVQGARPRAAGPAASWVLRRAEEPCGGSVKAKFLEPLRVPCDGWTSCCTSNAVALVFGRGPKEDK